MPELTPQDMNRYLEGVIRHPEAEQVFQENLRQMTPAQIQLLEDQMARETLEEELDNMQKLQAT